MSERLKEAIRDYYAGVAKAAATGTGCCGPTTGCCGSPGESEDTGGLYTALELAGLPDTAVLASRGCGNPTALAELVPGEVVLDLGSGGGIDVLLSAKRVGPAGKVYGLDMTDEMLALARENQRKAGVTNVEFLKGDMEAIPLPDDHVDVIISNCVVNLAPDKDKVFREAFRALKPGGRLAISDIVFQGDVSLLPAAIRRALAAWAGCVAGALEERDYIARLQAAGFTDVSLEVTRVYGDSALPGCCGGTLPAGLRLVSGFVRAKKPGAGPFTIRRATPADLPAVRRLLKEARLPLDGLADQFAGGYTVAEAGGRVIGVAGLETYADERGRYGLLRSVTVDSAWRGHGAGEAVVRRALAGAADLDAVWLLTETAAAWFPRFGFTPADRAAAPAVLRHSVEFAGACPAGSAALVLRLR